MQVGEKTETVHGEPVEIHSLGDYTASVYQLDDEGERIKKYRGQGYLMGIMTIKEKEYIEL